VGLTKTQSFNCRVKRHFKTSSTQ